MKRLILALLLGGLAAGCTGIHPIGPFAKPGAGPKDGPGKDKDKDKYEAPEPVTVPAVRPTPPMNTVGPQDVSPENPHFARQKLLEELEADRQRITPAPVTAEVSRYKGGVKQE